MQSKQVAIKLEIRYVKDCRNINLSQGLVYETEVLEHLGGSVG